MIDIISPIGLLTPFVIDPESPPVDLPRDLLDAIVAKFAATPELAGAFPGGIHRDEVSGPPRYPVLIIAVVGRQARKNQGRGYWEEIILRFTAYSKDGDEAEELGDLLLDHFDDRELAFRRGYLMSFQHAGGGSPPVPGRTKDNAKLWCRIVNFRTKVGRNPR